VFESAKVSFEECTESSVQVNCEAPTLGMSQRAYLIVEMLRQTSQALFGLSIDIVFYLAVGT
jgi:hypothetical protein